MGLLDDGSLLAREDPLVAEVLDGGGLITCYLVPGKNLISVMIMYHYNEEAGIFGLTAIYFYLVLADGAGYKNKLDKIIGRINIKNE